MTVIELKKELNKILRENPEAKDYEVRIISLSQVGYCTDIEVNNHDKEIILGE